MILINDYLNLFSTYIKILNRYKYWRWYDNILGIIVGLHTGILYEIKIYSFDDMGFNKYFNCNRYIIS